MSGWEVKTQLFRCRSPLIEFASIDMEKAFWASRYQRGEDDYINCPMASLIR
jgi:methylenetetrahydrofolate--tRNA-(uracil-5-)-methyltransferase